MERETTRHPNSANDTQSLPNHVVRVLASMVATCATTKPPANAQETTLQGVGTILTALVVEVG
jgi:hypothetical protein